MELHEAVELIRPAIPTTAGTWADFGAGTGLFTHALAELVGSGGRIIAVDQDARALQAIRQSARGRAGTTAEIIAVEGDFQHLDSIPELVGIRLSGALFASALHFVADAESLLAEMHERTESPGRIVVVEYDGRRADRWVPFPVSLDRLSRLASHAGFQPPRVVGERPSAYGGIMYCAVLERFSDVTGEPRLNRSRVAEQA